MARTDPPPIVDRSDLADAFEWVSASVAFENAAYVCRATGRIYWVGEGVEEPDGLPEDIEDGSQYICVPHKQDLGLGKALALDFTDEYMKSHAGEVHKIFSRAGAYGRFKSLLERQGVLEHWYRFESSAVESALEKWASENGFSVGTPRK